MADLEASVSVTPYALISIVRDSSERVQEQRALHEELQKRSELAEVRREELVFVVVWRTCFMPDSVQIKGQFAQTIFHELRIPLQNMLLGIDELTEIVANVGSVGAEQEDKELLDVMRDSSRRCVILFVCLCAWNTLRSQAPPSQSPTLTQHVPNSRRRPDDEQTGARQVHHRLAAYAD